MSRVDSAILRFGREGCTFDATLRVPGEKERGLRDATSLGIARGGPIAQAAPEYLGKLYKEGAQETLLTMLQDRGRLVGHRG